MSGCGCVLMLVGRTALFAFGFICCCGFDLRDLLHGWQLLWMVVDGLWCSCFGGLSVCFDFRL